MLFGRFFYFVLLIVSSGVTGNLALLTQKRGKNKESKLFGLLLLAITIYSFGYGFELISNTLPRILFWSKFQYFGIVWIAPLWIILALQYNGLDNWLTRPLTMLIFLIPILTLLIEYTNLQHLFYLRLVINCRGPFPTFAPIKGIWYWVNITYQNLALLTGMLLFLIAGRRTAKLYHSQVIVILTGFAFPWIGQLIYLSGHSPWNLDLVPLTLPLSAITFFWGLQNFSLFDIVPIARTKIFESIHDGVLVLDNQNRIVDLNTAAKQMIGLRENCLGLNITQAFADYPLLLKQLLSHTEQAIIRFENEGRDQYIESRLSEILDNSNRIIGYTVILTDQSEQIELLNKLRTLATIDSLTNVYNRRHFFETCQQKMIRLQQLKQPAAFILIDLDHFKAINDTYGHQTGDIVLKQAAANLINGLSGQKNIIGRVGGEEFAILLPEYDLSRAYRLAERLRSLVDIIIPVNDKQISLTASFGVSGGESANTDLDLLFCQADEALYRSKDQGRNMVAVFNRK
jgi:diguanylate cyclase (GGDEF)-like protein/PAS domain S-box-containing protein